MFKTHSFKLKVDLAQDNIFFTYTVLTDLAPQVAGANGGGPGTIKINENC